MQFVLAENLPWTTTRIVTMVLFLCTAMAWIFSKKLTENFGISQPDTWIAILAACLVVILGKCYMGKQVAENTDWGVLYLFGGG